MGFFGGSFFEKKNCWHFEFSMNQIFGQMFIIFEKLRYRVYYRWNYGLSKLLLHFIEYRLDQLNNKHTKIAVNSTIQYFEGHSQKKCLPKVFLPIHHKMAPCKVFAKLNGNHLLMASIFKLRNIRHLVSSKRIVWAKFGLLITNLLC